MSIEDAVGRYAGFMSHRERLLAAARRCLVTKGYAHTTARDLVAESGTNLGSIGYHFGSKEELLNLALADAQAEYAEKILAVAAPLVIDDAGRQRMRESWVEMVAAFDDQRPLGIAFFEALVQAERAPVLSSSLAASYGRMRDTIAAAFEGGQIESNEQRQAMATYVIAVCDGLMIQWLLDPDKVPSGDKVFDAAQALHR
jgi:AcrR family transcriptional regulator